MNYVLHTSVLNYNIVLSFSTWIHFLLISVGMTIVPIGEHPGCIMYMNGGFFHIGLNIYYCDHEAH